MKKRFDRYFGSNVGRKLYTASLATIAVGALIGYFYWWGYGMPLVVIGVIGFFVSSGIQVTDKDIDEQVYQAIESLKGRIDGRELGKETLDSRDFSYFHGYIRETSETRFARGRDGKVRTSRFYLTAISAKPKNAKVFSIVIDLLSDDATTNDQFICTNGAIGVELGTEQLDFPAGNKKCRLIVTQSEERTETLEFFLPNDALADKLLDTIVQP
ncbi:MAG: hypothetical protein IKZ05_06995 [Clostridia bacterium]|nr:hypothetical protein [Clostridia bacterium]